MADQYDFILLTETWFKDETQLNRNFTSYKKLVENRPDGYGGVAIMSRHSFTKLDRFTCTNNDFQSIAIVVGNMIICCVYRMHTHYKQFVDYLDVVLDYVVYSRY